ncbi:MAG: polysaccharide deacetylase family protein [Oscillospiraceae bacterium]|nr:polysaccharide deacetylase family protein [Oscillospiraceae bacterium]
MKIRALILCAAIICSLSLTGCRTNTAGGNNAATNTVHTTAGGPVGTPTATTRAHIAENNGEVIDETNTAVEGNPPTAEHLPAMAFTIPTNNDVSKISNTKIGWGLGKAADSSGRPTDAVIANEKYKIYNAKFIGENERKIYLTFDEGYENGYTPSILDTLKEKGVQATFFVTYDYCKNNAELVNRMLAEGHTVGNHSHTHPSFPDLSAHEVNDEITYLHDYVEKNFGYKMTLIRFPMGEFSDRTLAIANNLGYKSIFWSFAYLDWDVNNQPAPTEAFKKIAEGTHPGAIILLHAVSATNAAILPDLIDFWHDNGWELAVN